MDIQPDSMKNTLFKDKIIKEKSNKKTSNQTSEVVYFNNNQKCLLFLLREIFYFSDHFYSIGTFRI